MSKVLIVAEHLGGKLNASAAKCVSAAQALSPEAIDIVVLAADPTRHDAIENLANAYYAMDSTTALIATAEQLVALEPLSYSGVKLLANGYKKAEDKQKQKPKTFEAFNRLLGMTVSLESVSFSATDSGASLTLAAVGRPGADVRGNPLKPAGAAIVVEFLDAGGAVVASQAVSVPALARKSNP